ncbi:hypothetical protein DIPPA_31364 [Diplonema papillatum]|nr:hypothetical protein DIPPA_31364 [Diplonema papillatum]
MGTGGDALDTWSTDDCCAWLQACELGQLQGSFRRNRVDGRALVAIAKEDLRDELSIVSYLDRKILWGELTALRRRYRVPDPGNPPCQHHEEDSPRSLSQSLSAGLTSSALVGPLSPLSPPLTCFGSPPSPSLNTSASVHVRNASEATTPRSTTGSDNSTSDWSCERRARYNLRVSPDVSLTDDQQRAAVRQLKRAVGGERVSVASFTKFLCGGAPGAIDGLEAILTRLLFGLAGKSHTARAEAAVSSQSLCDSNDVLHQPLSSSAVTLLRSYGLSCQTDGTIATAARALTQLPPPHRCQRFVRDTFRVCEGIGPLASSATAPLHPQALSVYVQVYGLSDILHEAARTPSPPPVAVALSDTPPPEPPASPSPPPQQHPPASDPVELGLLAALVQDHQDIAEKVLQVLLQRLAPAGPSSASPSGREQLPVRSLNLLRAYGVAMNMADPTLASCARSLRTACSAGKLRKFLADLLKILRPRSHAEVVELFGLPPRRAPAAANPLSAAPPAPCAPPGGSVCSVDVDTLDVGSHVVVRNDAEEVKRLCLADRRLGWDPNMAGCCGKRCVVKRVSKSDRAAGKVLLSAEGVGTWVVPVAACQPAPPEARGRRLVLCEKVLACLDPSGAPIHAAPAHAAPVVSALPDRSIVHIAEESGAWLRLHGGGWVVANSDTHAFRAPGTPPLPLPAERRHTDPRASGPREKVLLSAEGVGTWVVPVAACQPAPPEARGRRLVLCEKVLACLDPSGAPIHAAPAHAAPVVSALPDRSIVHIAEESGAWLRLHGGGWVVANSDTHAFRAPGTPPLPLPAERRHTDPRASGPREKVLLSAEGVGTWVVPVAACQPAPPEARGRRLVLCEKVLACLDPSGAPIHAAPAHAAPVVSALPDRSIVHIAEESGAWLRLHGGGWVVANSDTHAFRAPGTPPLPLPAERRHTDPRASGPREKVLLSAEGVGTWVVPVAACQPAPPEARGRRLVLCEKVLACLDPSGAPIHAAPAHAAPVVSALPDRSIVHIAEESGAWLRLHGGGWVVANSDTHAFRAPGTPPLPLPAERRHTDPRASGPREKVLLSAEGVGTWVVPVAACQPAPPEARGRRLVLCEKVLACLDPSGAPIHAAPAHAAPVVSALPDRSIVHIAEESGAWLRLHGGGWVVANSDTHAFRAPGTPPLPLPAERRHTDPRCLPPADPATLTEVGGEDADDSDMSI